MNRYLEDIDKEEIKSSAYYDSCGNLKFDPHVFEQRYMTTIRILNHPLIKSHIKKVLEFGVNDMKFFIHLKALKHIEKIVQVDIDGDLLRKSLMRTEPLLADFLNQRQTPLTVEVFQGQFSVPDQCLLGSDAVIGIEVIEHVYDHELRDIPANIFSFVKPKIVILTTPNKEFNVMFPMLSGFRHDDHKFEWTRQEFENWCNKICEDYPDYCVQFHEVGRGPELTEHLGSVSQLGLFIRKDFLKIINDPLSAVNEEMGSEINELTLANTKPDEKYQLIHKVSFPFEIDSRSRDQKISDDANYHLSRFRSYEKYNTSGVLLIPLKELLDFTHKITKDLSELRSVLKKEYKIIDDILYLEPIISSDEETYYELDNIELNYTNNATCTDTEEW